MPAEINNMRAMDERSGRWSGGGGALLIGVGNFVF